MSRARTSAINYEGPNRSPRLFPVRGAVPDTLDSRRPVEMLFFLYRLRRFIRPPRVDKVNDHT